MMIGRQRERITSGLTTMFREHNRASSSSSSPTASSSSSSSNSSLPTASAATSSSVASGSISLRRDRLLSMANSSFPSSCGNNSELQEEDVWITTAGSMQQESSIWEEQDSVQASSTVSSSSRPVFTKWRTNSQEAWNPSRGGGISAPMNVPDWGKILKNATLESSATTRSMRGRGDDEEDEEDDCGKENWIPPHKLVDLRSRTMLSSSVFEGAGRTLKGWDLRRMRNRVWEQTGFLGV